MILKFFSNLFTLVFLSFHIYNHYKVKKTQTRTKQYPYIFIVLALLFSFEQTFSFVLELFPFFHLLKLLLVCVICFPYTNMAQMLYKEYLVRIMKSCEDNVDEKISQFGQKWRIIVINMYDQMFEAFNKKRNAMNNIAGIKGIELKSIEEKHEDVKAIKED